MTDSRKTIRPVLNLSSEIDEELFQNETLRPILKLQNQLIVLFFKSLSKKYKLDISSIPKESILIKIEDFIKKNTVARNQYIGLVLGQFTAEEYLVYTKKESEYNKRIIQMIAQRIADNLL